MKIIKFKKKNLIASLTIAIPLITTITSTCSIGVRENNGQDRESSETENKLQANDNKSVQIAKEFFNKIKNTSVSTFDYNANKRAKIIAKTINSSHTVNRQIKDDDKKIPEKPTGFDYEISAVANDRQGTITVKIALKKDNKYYNPITGIQGWIRFGNTKDIVINGYDKYEGDLIVNHFNQINSQVVTVDANKDKLPSTVLSAIGNHSINDLKKINALIKDYQIPSPLNGYEYEISATANDNNRTITFQIALKKGNKYYHPLTGDESLSKNGNTKEIVISGYLKTERNEKMMIVDHFKKIPSKATTIDINKQKLPSTITNVKKDQQITNLQKANALIKDHKIPAVLDGYTYDISVDNSDAEGIIIIKVALKKGNQYYSPNTGGQSQTKDGNTKEILISGFATTEKTLSPMNDPYKFIYQNSFSLSYEHHFKNNKGITATSWFGTGWLFDYSYVDKASPTDPNYTVIVFIATNHHVTSRLNNKTANFKLSRYDNQKNVFEQKKLVNKPEVFYQASGVLKGDKKPSIDFSVLKLTLKHTTKQTEENKIIDNWLTPAIENLKKYQNYLELFAAQLPTRSANFYIGGYPYSARLKRPVLKFNDLVQNGKGQAMGKWCFIDCNHKTNYYRSFYVANSHLGQGASGSLIASMNKDKPVITGIYSGTAVYKQNGVVKQTNYGLAETLIQKNKFDLIGGTNHRSYKQVLAEKKIKTHFFQ